MNRSFLSDVACGLLAGFCLAACGGTARAPAAMGPAGTPSALTPAALSRADGGRPPFSAADVEFMTGMIPHHAQAVLVAGWAASRDASPAVRVLCERIVVAQRDEIAFMQRWLRERNQPVPPGDASHHMAAGADHALMPGMLTGEQLTQLDAARGPEFDRLFLMYMIQHHEGALTMVDRLFASHGAAQDDDVYKLAADIHADQVTEIERMQAMLAAMASAGRNP